MKTLLITALITASLIIGCTSNPTTPDPVQPHRAVEYWGDVMPDGWHANGSLMDEDDLAYYFAAHMSEVYLPGGMDHPHYCHLFEAVQKYILDHYPLGMQLVRFYERNLCDVPDTLDIEVPC